MYIYVVFIFFFEIFFPKPLGFLENVVRGSDRTGVQHERGSAGVPYTWVHPEHVATPLIILTYTQKTGLHVPMVVVKTWQPKPRVRLLWVKPLTRDHAIETCTKISLPLHHDSVQAVVDVGV